MIEKNKMYMVWQLKSDAICPVYAYSVDGVLGESALAVVLRQLRRGDRQQRPSTHREGWPAAHAQDRPCAWTPRRTLLLRSERRKN